jgi:hypothetical protein
MKDSDRGTDSNEDTTWEPNPLPLMAKHPPRVTVSNTKIQMDREGILNKTCPKGENDLGWVQLQQKSFLWQETIEESLVVTHEALTTMAHSRPHAKLKKVWRKRTFSLPRDTSFWSSNDYDKSIGYMTYQRCRHQPSSPHLPEEMSAGGEHKM